MVLTRAQEASCIQHILHVVYRLESDGSSTVERILKYHQYQTLRDIAALTDIKTSQFAIMVDKGQLTQNPIQLGDRNRLKSLRGFV